MKSRILIALFVCSLPGTIHAQHDGARDSVRLIADGKFQKVDKTLEDKKPFAGEAESAFVQMLSSLAQDELGDALAQAREAVELGLPIERLIVGPREQLSKLHTTAEFQSWMASKQVSPLIHGPMVGNVTDQSAAIWVRTSRPTGVVVRASADDAEAQSSDGQTTSESDFTTVVSLRDLKSETVYRYDVVVDDKPIASGQFRTFPAEKTSGVFSVGFGGGAGYVPEWESMWDTIVKSKPDAFLMLGDNVYIDQPEKTLTQHYCYYRRQSRPEWKRMTSQIPIFSIWDDHDFGTNDCVPGPEIEKPKWKRNVWNIFKQNWANPGYGGGESQPGCWYDFRIGDVHFILLDGRYYRDLKGGTMLGPVQKQWLLETLADSDATFKIVASPVPFTAGIKKGSRDPWDGFPEEREEIFRHIESERIDGVVLIAADRHRTDLRKTSREDGYDLYEFESSRLTNHHTHPVVKTPGLIWGHSETCSFALMKFDTTREDPQIQLQCIDLEGQTLHTHVIKRSELEHTSR
ncbi:MAG: alkaline phosphatase [Pirellulaceae bacterium]|nr:alkaline phosphatase [Pirellulaceae bacterium]